MIDRAKQQWPDESAGRQIGGVTTGDRLLLIRNRNDLHTVALLHAAIRSRKVAGIIDERQLDQITGLDPTDIGPDLSTIDVPVERGAALVCFTSGSTGSAKAILRRYDTWLRSYALQRDILKYGRDTSVLVLGNLAHSMHIYGALEALDRGVVPTVEKKFSPRRAFQHLQAGNGDLVYATPAHLNLMLAHAATHKQPPASSVRHVLSGGAKLNEARMDRLAELFPNATIAEFFGTTETSYITIKGPDAPDGSVGRACPGVRLRILDQRGRRQPAGVEGTLWVRSDMLFDRYLVGDDPNTRWQDGYLTIGDRGYLDESGNFFFTAREGSMVTIAGENVFLDHVEGRLRARIADGEAAVVPVADPMRGTRLMAATDQHLAPEEVDSILQALRSEFGPLRAPRALSHIADWPALPSGKTDRRMLATMIAGAT